MDYADYSLSIVGEIKITENTQFNYSPIWFWDRSNIVYLRAPLDCSGGSGNIFMPAFCEIARDSQIWKVQSDGTYREILLDKQFNYDCDPGRICTIRIPANQYRYFTSDPQPSPMYGWVGYIRNDHLFFIDQGGTVYDTAEDVHENQFSWNRTAEKVVYYSGTEGMVILDEAGIKNAIILPGVFSSVENPVWLENDTGKYIIFSARTDTQPSALFVSDESGEYRRIAEGYGHILSNDGRSIVYITEGKFMFAHITADGKIDASQTSNPYVLLDIPQTEWEIYDFVLTAFTPDNSKIAYYLKANIVPSDFSILGKDEIIVRIIDWDGSDETEICRYETPAGAGDPAFASDFTALAYVPFGMTSSDIWVKYFSRANQCGYTPGNLPGTIVSDDDSLEVTVPRESMYNDLDTMIITAFDTDQNALFDTTYIEPVLSSAYDVGLLSGLDAFRNNGIELLFKYNDAQIAGLNEEDLNVFTFDFQTGRWRYAQSDSGLVERNPEKNTVAIRTDHLSLYILAAVPFPENAPEITMCDLFPGIISPDNNGNYDTAAISVKVSQNAAVAMNIFTAAEENILYRSINTFADEESTVIWDGRDKWAQTMADGIFRINLKAMNLLGIWSAELEKIVKIDLTPPVSGITFGIPFFNNGQMNFIGGNSAVEIFSDDPVVSSVSSGIAGISYSLNGQKTDYSGPFVMTEEGIYELYYGGSDNAGNIEVQKKAVFVLDRTPPVSNTLMAGAHHEEYISSCTEIMLSATDGGEFPSGIKNIRYALSGGDTPLWTDYTAPFKVSGADGSYLLEYFSTDNVENREDTNDRTIKLDNTGPATNLDFSAASVFQTEDKFYVSSRSELRLEAIDPENNGVSSGIKTILVSRDGGVFAESVPFNLEEGIHEIRYYALDKVLNREDTNSRVLYVDATPPITEITLSGGCYDAFGKDFISQNTRIVLNADDPENLGVSSGVQKILWTADGIWKEYTEPFSLPFGTHDVRFYSVDNVGNESDVRERELFVAMPGYACFGMNGILLQGNGKIYGDAGSNESIILEGNSLIDGNAETCKEIKIGNHCSVTGEIRMCTAPLMTELLSLDEIERYVSENNDNGNLTLTEGKLVIEEENISIPAGVYYLTGIEISGTANVEFDCGIEIFCKGNMYISGQANINTAGEAGDLLMLFSPGESEERSLLIEGNGKLNSIIYAPDFPVDIGGNGITLGNVLGGDVLIDGLGTVIGAEYERETAAAKSLLSDLRKTADDLDISKIQIVPNPCRNGCINQNINITLSTPAEISVKIFSISGENIYKHTVNGTAGCNTVEWTCISDAGEAVSSGVYIVVVEANGKRKILKTALVR